MKMPDQFSYFSLGALVYVALNSSCANLLNTHVKYMAPNLIRLFPGSQYFKDNCNVDLKSCTESVFCFLKYVLLCRNVWPLVVFVFNLSVPQ